MITLADKFTPSPACNCDICMSYCKRPGWWTVDQASLAIERGYANRMMMEISPEFDFAVLSPAFYGCEGFMATQEMFKNGCNFLKNGLCELHNTDLLPLECAFCHHERVGQGIVCHNAIEREWKTYNAQLLVKRWQNITCFHKKLKSTDQRIHKRY